MHVTFAVTSNWFRNGVGLSAAIFRGHFYAFQGLFLRSRYRIWDILGFAKISKGAWNSYIYIYIFFFWGGGWTVNVEPEPTYEEKWEYQPPVFNSQGPKGQKIGPVQIVCRLMVTYIKIFNEVLPLFWGWSLISNLRLRLVMTSSIWGP